MIFTRAKNICWSFLFVFAASYAQQTNTNWQEISETRTTTLVKKTRKTMPEFFTLFELEKNTFIDILATAPSRNSLETSNVIIKIPVGNKGTYNFRVYENSVLASELQTKYPSIKAFTGQGLEDPSAVATITSSNNGVHIMITSATHKTMYIDPYTRGENFYISYSRESLPPNPFGFECLIEETITKANLANSATRNADDGMLRTYRLALVCTGEYALFHLSDQGIPNNATDTEKKTAILGAMNTSMARVNGVFERDVALRMVLVPNNDEIIFLDPTTDGLTNNSPVTLINECQFICDTVIGDANYDIGHVFSTQGGGIASLNSPCSSGNKARGVTGIGTPMGDPYDIDYVAHEMGHQYGANHPQNNNCNRSNASIEPGSASSIMGYAGICPPNVQNNSDDYFNGFSIIEMWTGINNNDCAPKSNTNNEAPIVNAGPNYSIPHSTPFILKGNAADPNTANQLSYCWEQMDTTPAIMPPAASATAGPLFRTLDPVEAKDRYMPALTTVLNNQLGTTWERLPGVARNMNFRLTVRDNVAGGGASGSDLVQITTTSIGPFEVTSQGATTAWGHNIDQVITWEVAGSNAAPVNAPNVDILLSLDGGENFDVILASGVPNDGEHMVISPAIDTNQARLMVRGTDHVFYDINESNFVIDGTLGTETVSLNGLTIWPNPSDGNYNISFTSENNSPVIISLYDVRGRKLAAENFESNGSIFNTSVNYSAIADGMYFMNIVQGNASLTKQVLKN